MKRTIQTSRVSGLRRAARAPLAVAVLGALVSLPASAFEFGDGEFTGSLNTTLSYGASMRVQERDDNLVAKSHFDPTIVSQILFRDALRLGNLDARRDWTFVDDTVAGFLRAAEAAGIDGETFNLGTGEEASVRELAERVAQLLGKPLEIQVDPARLRPTKSEVQRLLSDNRRAKVRLNWEPAVGLDEGLERTIDWVREARPVVEPMEYRI